MLSRKLSSVSGQWQKLIWPAAICFSITLLVVAWKFVPLRDTFWVVGLPDAPAAQIVPAPLPAALEPTPVPTPTPNPIVEAHKIPVWAQSKIIRDVPVAPGEKVIALTFDDGPWPDYTKQILQILAQHNAKATFYMVGQVVQEYPQIARAVLDGGHAVGNHSWSHPLRPRDANEQIERTDAIIKKTLGITPTTYRPPYGALKNGMDTRAIQLHKPIVLWSCDSNDWKRPSSAQMASTMLNQATPGGIVLMHDGGGSRQHTVRALPTVLKGLTDRGYRFVTVPELLRLRHFPESSSAQNQPVRFRSAMEPKSTIRAELVFNQRTPN